MIVMFSMSAKIQCYLLPTDAVAAEKDFLDHLRGKGETWIIAYGFTLVPMIDELIGVHKRGKKLHLYLDHTQASGKAETVDVDRLVHAGVEVTIGTSPVRGLICHTKGVVVDGVHPWCWEGSVNFSNNGFSQVNTAMAFESKLWRDRFVQQFEELRAFAWAKERRYQRMGRAPGKIADSRHRRGARRRGTPGTASL